MNHKNLKLLNILSVYVLLPILLILSTFKPAHAQSSSNNSEQDIRTLINFKAQEEVPDSSGGGGSRGVLKLVMPTTNQLLLTTKAKPTFFIYIGKNNIEEVNFILQDQETQKILYETTISLRGNPGVIAIRLPADSPSLTVETTYIFGVTYLEGSALELVNGQIKRVELNPTVSRQLENADQLNQAVLYAENGIWFDTLEVLAELKQSQPENATFATEWRELLTSVGLNDIATKPLVDLNFAPGSDGTPENGDEAGGSP